MRFLTESLLGGTAIAVFMFALPVEMRAAGPAPSADARLEFGTTKDEVRQKLAKRASQDPQAGRITPETKLEDRGEFYRVGQTTIGLHRVPGQFAVRWRAGVNRTTGLRALRAQVGTVECIGSSKPKNIDVVAIATSDSSETLSNIRRNPSVERVFPVYAYPKDGARMVATDDLIVCVESPAVWEGLAPALEPLGLRVVERLPLKHIYAYLVRLEPNAKVDALGACEKVLEWPGVRWAEPDFAREIFFDFTPNDPLFPQQQNLHNTGQNGAVTDADIDASEAWNVTLGAPSVVIAIIDDGVDTSHTDLAIAPGGYDFYNNDNDPSPTGTDGHGTGCAGVAAAVANNATLVAGVAGGCKILPIKIAEGAAFASNTVIGNAISYAADRADILSNSWGGGAPSSFINNAIDYAVTYGRAGKGCPVFFASGNSASGWYRGGSRYRLSTSGLTGTYLIHFDYSKDNALASGLDTVYIDNVCLLSADGYTHLWREDFEGPVFPPSGWSLASSSGAAAWFRTSTNAYTATGGTNSARAGAIGNNQWTDLILPPQTLTGTETLAFAAYVSTQANKDLFWVDVYTTAGVYVGSWGPFSGVPSITTSVAYPANYVNSIAVGAASDCDRRADYSQYGPELDFVAPTNGGWNDIVTLDPTGAVGWTPSDVKFNFGGTSAACPVAAGIGALRLSYNPTETASSLRSWLRAHCDKIGPLPYSGGDPGAGGRNDQYGYGRVNAMLMVPVTISKLSAE